MGVVTAPRYPSAVLGAGDALATAMSANGICRDMEEVHPALLARRKAGAVVQTHPPAQDVARRAVGRPQRTPAPLLALLAALAHNLRTAHAREREEAMILKILRRIRWRPLGLISPAEQCSTNLLYNLSQ